jgi:hypothetical protein
MVSICVEKVMPRFNQDQEAPVPAGTDADTDRDIRQV